MTPLGRRCAVVSLFVLAAWLLVALIQSHEAYAERKKVSGTTTVAKRLAQMLIEEKIGDFWVNTYSLSNRFWIFSRSDPDWNNTTSYGVHYYEVNTRSILKGYAVDTHQGGDQTFWEYEGMNKLQGGCGGTVSQYEGWFIGGTGKFKGMTGKWTMKITRAETETISAWEAEYEIKQ